MNYQGPGFSIDALADPGLVANNFAGKPKAHIRSGDGTGAGLNACGQSRARPSRCTGGMPRPLERTMLR